MRKGQGDTVPLAGDTVPFLSLFLGLMAELAIAIGFEGCLVVMAGETVFITAIMVGKLYPCSPFFHLEYL